MSGIQLVRLKDCCQVVGGATPKRNISEYWGNDVPWVTPKDVSNLDSAILEDAPEYISKAGYENCATYLLPKHSILLTSRAPIGNVAIAGRDMCTNQGFKSLVPGDGVDYSYLYHCIKYKSPKLQELGNGATFKEVSKKTVEEFKIPLPPMEEQKRIAAILDKADALCRKRQQAIELTDQLLRSVFLDMFGDPVTNPKGWDKILLDSVCKKITDGTHHSPKAQVSGVPYVTAKHVKPNRVEFDLNPTYVSEEAHKEIYARCNPECGDILYIKDGATTGIAAINPYDFEFSMLSSLALIKVDEKQLLSEFLCDWLNFVSVKARILKNISGAAITRLTIRKIKDLTIELPPLELQEEYLEIRSKLMDSQTKLGNSIESSDTLFSSLTQQAFRGELIKQTKAA